MRGLTPILNRRQRRAMYDLVRDHLSGLNDVRIALDRKDFATAQRLGREFAEDFRLLEDLGWTPNEERQTFDLTMPDEALHKAMRRLRDEANDGLSGSEETQRLSEQENKVEARYRLASEVCTLLLRDPADPRRELP